MAKRRSIVWKFFELVEQEKDGKKIKYAACNICADTTLTYVGETSNLLHHLEVKHPSEYSKVKEQQIIEADTFICLLNYEKVFLGTWQRNKHGCSGFHFVGFTPHCCVDGPGVIRLLTCLEPGYTVPSRTFVMNSLKQ